jgi:acetyl-CoA carboxylase biotin carboxyl carrier protein
VELKHIKELMASMGRTGTKRLQIKQNDFELTLERHDIVRPTDLNMEYEEQFRQHQMLNRTDQALSHGTDMTTVRNIPMIETKIDDKSTYVTSPMVGTFYNAPSPDDAPFIKPGDKVEKNTIVGIIEAMKVMNEIKANVTGTIAEILVESGQPVEFGSKLFRVVE